MKDKIWGFTAGLLLAAGVFGHALRLVVLIMERVGPRHYVACFAIILYLITAILVFFKNKIGLWLTILGPLGGITAVSLSPNAHIDLFQIVLDIPQFLAIGCAVYLLLKKNNHK